MWFLDVLALGACLPPCEGGACLQKTLPGLDDPFLFTLHAWANGFRAFHHFCFASLAYCTLARKVPGGSSCGTSPGPVALVPAARAPLGPPSVCWECWLPPYWVDSWYHLEPLVPLGGEDLSMLSVGTPSVCWVQRGQLVPSASELSMGKASLVQGCLVLRLLFLSPSIEHLTHVDL